MVHNCHIILSFAYFNISGTNLYHNAQIPVGSDVTIDISGIHGSGAVICELSLDDSWDSHRMVYICLAFSPDHQCHTVGQYQGRSSLFNDTTLLITGVFKNESGIYRCRRTDVVTPVVIAGVIIVGMVTVDSFVY